MEQMIKALEHALERNAALIAQVNSSNLSNPTPCKNFDIKGVVNHVIGGAQMFAAIAKGEEFKPAGPDLVGDDPSGAYLAAKEQLLGAFADPSVFQRTFVFPFAELPAPAGIGVMLMESYVHGWDIAKGLGVDAEIDPMIATMLLEGAKQSTLTGMRSPDGSPFAEEVSVPDSASPTEKLVAFLGRTP